MSRVAQLRGAKFQRKAGRVSQMGRRVYVGNLSWDASWQDLKDHMRGPNGDLNVVHAEVLMDGSGRSKGCGIVEYASPQVRWMSLTEHIDVLGSKYASTASTFPQPSKHETDLRER